MRKMAAYAIQIPDYIVHNPTYFPERYQMLNNMDINDANWLFHILDKLARIPNFGEYISVLDKLDEFDLFTSEQKEQAILNLRNKIFSIKPYKPEEQLKSVIDKFINRHQTRIEKAIKNKDIYIHDKVMISFILTNKLIIWSIDRDYNDIHLLRKVRSSMEKFLIGEANYIDVLLGKNLRGIIDSIQLKYHVAILTFIMDQLQKQSGKFGPEARLGYNTIKRVFEKTSVLSLKRLIDLDNNTFYENELKKFIYEYKQIYRNIEELSLNKFETDLNNLIERTNINSGIKCQNIKIVS